MKIAITTDTHLGHSHNTYKVHTKFLKKLRKDCDENEVDVLIHAGDWISHNQHQLPRAFKMFREAMGGLPILGVEGNHDCLDTETELLTKRGWIRYDRIVKSDFILSINDEGFSEWTKINKIIIKKSEKMYKVSNKNIDMCITEKHRILHKKRLHRKRKKSFSEFKYLTISEMKTGRYRIPLAAANNNPDYPISDNEIQLLAWVFTDSSRGRGCQIYQSKKKNIKKIKKILDNLNYKYSFSTRNRNIESICGKKLKKKPLPQCMFNIYSESLSFIREWVDTDRRPINSEKFNKFSKKQLFLFFRTLMDGDGSYASNGSDAGVIDGKKEVLDWFQSLAVQSGIRGFIVRYRPNNFRLNICFGKDSVQIEKIGKKAKQIEYNSSVWCLSVPYTNFMVRRNGKAYFTGNCWDYDYHGVPLQKRRWAKHPAGMSLPQMMKQHKEWAIEYNIQLLENNPYRHDGQGEDDTIILGFNGWYNTTPITNDSQNMAKMYESCPVHPYLSNKAAKDLDHVLREVEYKGRENKNIKKICVTHFPPYSKDSRYVGFCANPIYLNFIAEKFDILIVGHSHQQEDFVEEIEDFNDRGSFVHKIRCINAGTNFDNFSGGYDKPNYKIIEI